MAARGTEAKNVIFNKLQEVFSDAFFEEPGKILRIPIEENGERIEIKVQLTAAKTNLSDKESAFSVEPVVIPKNSSEKSVSVDIEPTEEEKENVSKLIASLGL